MKDEFFKMFKTITKDQMELVGIKSVTVINEGGIEPFITVRYLDESVKRYKSFDSAYEVLSKVF